MIKSINNPIFTNKIDKRLISNVLLISVLLFSGNAFAGENEAKYAISRADAKIEMATRQAGLAGNKGDQSFNLSRDRLEAARVAYKDSQYDNAEFLADEASILAELTGEKAKLAALQTSADALTKAYQSTPQQ